MRGMTVRRSLLLAGLVVCCAVMLWPRSLEKAFDTTESVVASATIFDVTNGQIDNTYETYELPAGSEAGEAIGALLAQHTYHLTLSSLTGDEVIEGPTMVIHLFNGKEERLTLTGGTAELNLNHRIYRLDYWGADRGTELCEAVLAVLRETK